MRCSRASRSLWAHGRRKRAVLTQSVIRRSLSNYPLSRSARFASAWAVFDRLGVRLRESIRPTLRSDSQSLELERAAERSSLFRPCDRWACPLALSWSPAIQTSGSLPCRYVWSRHLEEEGAAVSSLSLRDLPHSPTELESQLGGSAIDDVMATGEVRPIRLLLVDGAESVLEGKGPGVPDSCRCCPAGWLRRRCRHANGRLTPSPRRAGASRRAGRIRVSLRPNTSWAR